MNEVSPELRVLLSRLVGLPLVTLKIGEHSSLSLTFGPNESNSDKEAQTACLGTWYEDWKIFDQDGKLLLARASAVAAPNINFGAYEDIEMFNGKVRLRLSLGHYVEFADRRMNDDIFYAFLPDHVFVGYAAKSGWRYGPSGRPWTGGKPI